MKFNGQLMMCIMKFNFCYSSLNLKYVWLTLELVRKVPIKQKRITGQRMYVNLFQYLHHLSMRNVKQCHVNTFMT